MITAKFSSSAGNYIAIEDKDGFVIKYMHCHELYVSKGDIVERGDLVPFRMVQQFPLMLLVCIHMPFYYLFQLIYSQVNLQNVNLMIDTDSGNITECDAFFSEKETALRGEPA